MNLETGTPTLDTLLALAASFLGLALLVQVVQEIYKYLTSSKSRTYHKVLRDFFGPWVEQLYAPGPAAHLQVRGPFQLLRSKPQGVLLPLEKEELLASMDALAADWLGYTLEALKAERRLQDGHPAFASPNLERALDNLREAAAGDAGDRNAQTVLEFLREWGVPGGDRDNVGEIDAARLVNAFYQRFFPDRIKAEREFGQLAKNFEHAYHRRNLRQTFIFGLLVATALDFPFDQVYLRARTLSPEAAAQLASAMTAASREGVSTSDERDLRETARTILTQLRKPDADGAGDFYQAGYRRFRDIFGQDARWRKLLEFSVNCLVTALLICFGAPFWHRLSEALLSIRKPGAGKSIEEP